MKNIIIGHVKYGISGVIGAFLNTGVGIWIVLYATGNPKDLPKFLFSGWAIYFFLITFVVNFVIDAVFEYKDRRRSAPVQATEKELPA